MYTRRDQRGARTQSARSFFWYGGHTNSGPSDRRRSAATAVSGGREKVLLRLSSPMRRFFWPNKMMIIIKRNYADELRCAENAGSRSGQVFQPHLRHCLRLVSFSESDIHFHRHHDAAG